MDEKQQEQYKTWKKLINMSANEIQKFLDSDEGKEAGLSRKESATAGASGGKIKSGRDSARAIIRMLGKKVEDWDSNDWEWSGRQVGFISRMKSNPGPLYDEKGRKTRKLLSLLVWGHDPRKKMNEEINIDKRDYEMEFEIEIKLFEAEEKKERVSTVPSDREIMFRKLMKMVNMSSAELQSFINSKESDGIGWSEDEAKKESVGGANFGMKDAKLLVSILRKGSKFKNSGVPDLTDVEWQAVGRICRFIARFNSNIGPNKDDEGNLTPKAKALMLRAFDPIKYGNKKLPVTQDVKQELKKEMEKKINETVSLANLFL